MKPSGVAVHLGSSCATTPALSGPSPSPHDRRITRSAIPPAVLLPTLRGESPALCNSFPLAMRGLGLAWPEAAALDKEGRGARLPLPWAWELMSGDSQAVWSFSEAELGTASLSVADAMAFAVFEIASKTGLDSRVQSACLVIPNDFDERSQQALLDSRYVRDRSLLFLWRPVAAALEWCQRKRADRVQDPSTNAPSIEHNPSSMDELLCLHLGLDGFEATILELVDSGGHGLGVLPARRRCRNRSPAGIGRRLVEEALRAALRSSSTHLDSSDHWRALWCSSLLPVTFGLIDHSTRDFAQQMAALGFTKDILPTFVRLLREASLYIVGHSSADPTGRLSSVRSELTDWMMAFRSSLGPKPPRAAMITGELASFKLGAQFSLGRAVSDHLGQFSPALLLSEGSSETPFGVLARGAALFLELRGRDEPTYLDTLSRMESVVLRECEPAWVNLLAKEDQYVDGGRPWVREPDFGPVIVRAGEETLDLDLWSESDDSIHHISYKLSHTTQQPVPATLRVTMQPAHGHARIELLPVEKGALGRRRLFLDWSTSELRAVSKAEVLENIERPFPPLEPRKPHRGMWQGSDLNRVQQQSPAAIVQELVQEGVESASEGKELLDRLRAALRAPKVIGDRFFRPPKGKLIRAVSSDGHLAPASLGQSALSRFLDQVETFLNAGNDLSPNLAAVLGYASADGPQIQLKLAALARTYWLNKGPVRGFHLAFLGNCLRDERSIRGFALSLLADLRQDPPALKERELKALAFVLMYRHHALRLVATETCEGLFEQAMLRFRHQLGKGRLSFTARAALQCMAFLLRRRCYADDFLDPNSKPALSAKRLLEIATEKLATLSLTGGSVSIPTVMRRISDYIDRRGVGRVVLITD